MKLDIKPVGVESGGVKKTMEFGIGDERVVIDILRNRLYSKPIQTLVQEYLCNARDAHREVGSTRCVVVTMPTSLSPVFKVRDFGPGVDPERYATVFVNYGSSTKRIDNTQTGGFGIGAKSAWSYSDSFNVTTFVDGIRRDYINHVGESNVGQADLVNESPTDELNGTEIQVPVSESDLHTFRQAIFRATYFWQEACQFLGVNQEDLPSRVGNLIEDSIEIVKKEDINPLVGLSDYNRSLIVSLDGIPYPVDSYDDANLKQVMAMLHDDWTTVVHLSTGDIDVAANREQINYSDSTKDALSDVASFMVAALRRYVGKKIAAVSNVATFFQTYRELTDEFQDVELDRMSLEFGEYRIKTWTVESVRFNDLDICEVKYKKKKRGYGTSTNRLVWDGKDRVKLKHLGKRIYYVDVNESQAKLTRRMKTALAEANAGTYGGNNDRSVTLIRPGSNPTDLYSVAIDLEAIPISTVEMSAVEKRPSMKELGEAVLHIFEDSFGRRGSRQRIRVTMDENEKTYVYVQLDENEFPCLSPELFAKWLRQSQPGDYEFCGVSSRALKVVQDDENFIPLDDFIANFVPTPGMIHNATWSRLEYETKRVVNLAQDLHTLRVKDDDFSLLASSLAIEFPTDGSQERETMPPLLSDGLALVENALKRAEQIEADVVAFNDLMANYPLLQTIVGNERKLRDSMRADMVLYMDTKKEQAGLTDGS